MTELICHTNDLKRLQPFFSLKNLQLLDLENNKISQESANFMDSLIVLNLRGNPVQMLDQLPKIFNPIQGVQEYSQFQRFGVFAFGEPSKPKPSKRLIKIA